MVRLVQKCGFIKGSSKGYMKYIATRQGVEMIKGNAPATVKQQKVINALLEDFPDAAEMFEYRDYVSAPTVSNASSFIYTAVDFNLDDMQPKSIYMKYIATRPRAEKRGTHGLFSSQSSTDLHKAMNELAEHRGTVWTIIYSLRREDAARLGYESAESWRNLICAHQGGLASALKIQPDNLKWYAAFHNEGHHPHIHLMVWSDDETEGFLSRQGVETLRSVMTNDIFEGEMYELYVRKDIAYKELRDAAQSVMSEAIEKMSAGTYENAVITEKMSELVSALDNCKGKKMYGYLPKPVKAIVDSIVDELEKQPDVAAFYSAWCDIHEQVASYYRTDIAPRVPISQRKEFRAIKNLIIKDAEDIRRGRFRPENRAEPEEYFPVDRKTEEGADWEDDTPRAYSAQGNAYAETKSERMDHSTDPALLSSAARLLYYMSRVFRANSILPTNPDGLHVDSKRRRYLQRKRMAAGHKPDDHDDDISTTMVR